MWHMWHRPLRHHDIAHGFLVGGRKRDLLAASAELHRDEPPRAVAAANAHRRQRVPSIHRERQLPAGRAEATGTALTLVAPEELRALEAPQRSVGIEMQG